MKNINAVNIFKLLFMIFLFIYGIWGAFHQEAFGLINGANLLFHEAGHVFFGFMGQYFGIWGGTLFQLLLPIMLFVAFAFKRDRYAMAVMMFWFGQNMMPISNYIKDARAQALPYVGGEIHDWNYILSGVGLLEFDQFVGNAVWGFGLFTMSFISFCGILYCLKIMFGLKIGKPIDDA